MAFKMRQSKFRHVYGNPLKKDQCYDNIRISKSSLDSTFCAVNPKYVAVITEAAGGGSFLVLPLQKTGRIERDHPLVSGHKGQVLDVKWCPHNDDVIASASDDCTIKVWQIPDDGLFVTNIEEPVVDLNKHQRRVNLIEWHPTALNIILSAGADNVIILWNCGTGEALAEVDLPDICLSMSFNYDGSQFVTTCKDKKIRVFNSKDVSLLQTGQGHAGSKPAQCAFLKNNKIFTTGFSKMSERQYALWNAKDLSKAITMTEIDNSNGVMFPFYDPDTGMVFLCGKGDSIIRFYEVTEEAPYVHYLNLFQSKDAQRGIGFMPKRGLNVNHCEISRFYKLLNTGLCEVIPFTVPRKSELFQDDLYPDTAGDVAAITAEEFLEGKKDPSPILISLKSGYVPSKKEVLTVRKTNVLDSQKKVGQQATHQPAAATNNGPAVASAPAPAGPALPAGFDAEKVLKDICDLKTIIKQHDGKIAKLEARVAELEEKPAEPEKVEETVDETADNAADGENAIEDN